jgi:serine/threonine-protein kinase HipA
LAETAPSIPPLVRLGDLLSAAEQVQREGAAEEEALRLLLAPGSSLGGARPKASVIGPGAQLLLAKFPAVNDAWPVCIWEHVTCELAAAAGVRVQQTRLVEAEGRRVLLAQRFDRDGRERVPFLSAMAMLGSRDDEDDHSYLEIADAIRQHGQAVTQDLEELWRRMVFNVLVTNTDDHLRNHGFLRGTQGWSLAPAYDLNPVPLDVKPRLHALLLDERSPRSSLETVLEVADYAGLDRQQARDVVRQVALATSRWRQVARAHGLGASEVERMASAFEHRDLELALDLSS